ncbi:hypothetical protein [Haloferula sp. BvORR071]|nr:hypothetical protein [Haloferula sp. BvORR071]
MLRSLFIILALALPTAAETGGWGWNFRTDAAGSKSDFLIKEVRVAKSKP